MVLRFRARYDGDIVGPPHYTLETSYDYDLWVWTPTFDILWCLGSVADGVRFCWEDTTL